MLQILRVFYDRLVDRKDGEWFLAFLKTTLTVSQSLMMGVMGTGIHSKGCPALCFLNTDGKLG